MLHSFTIIFLNHTFPFTRIIIICLHTVIYIYIYIYQVFLSNTNYLYTYGFKLGWLGFIAYQPFKSRRQYPTKQQLYGHLTPIMKTIQIRKTRHVGHCWRSRDELMTYSCGPLHMDEQRQDVQLGPTYNNPVLIKDLALKTYQKQWKIEKGGWRGSEKSMLMVQHDDDDDDECQILLINVLNIFDL